MKKLTDKEVRRYLENRGMHAVTAGFLDDNNPELWEEGIETLELKLFGIKVLVFLLLAALVFFILN